VLGGWLIGALGAWLIVSSLRARGWLD